MTMPQKRKRPVTRGASDLLCRAADSLRESLQTVNRIRPSRLLLRDRRCTVARFKIVTVIAAPIEVCFDLARDIDFHVRSMSKTGERAVAGRKTGLIGHGEMVTWKARHFGVLQRFTSRITEFARP